MKRMKTKPATAIERELDTDPYLKGKPKRKRLLKRWLNANPGALLASVESGLTMRCACNSNPEGIEGCPRHYMDEAVLLNLIQRYDRDLAGFPGGTLEAAARWEILKHLHKSLEQMNQEEKALMRLMHWMSTGVNICVPDSLFAGMLPLCGRFGASAHTDGGWEYAIHSIMSHYGELNQQEVALLLHYALPYDNGDERDGPGSLSNTIQWFKERIQEQAKRGIQ